MMTFDKSKVYTALNAGELEVGSEVILANYLESLKQQVEANSWPTYVKRLDGVMGTSSINRFKSGNMTYNLAYLVSKPEEKKLRPYINSAEMIADVIARFKVKCPSYCEPLIWLLDKELDRKCLVRDFESDKVMCGSTSWTMEELFDRWTYLDGSPIGMEVKE